MFAIANKPGTLAKFSSSKKRGPPVERRTAGPADYNVTTGNIRKRPETVAPFDTTGSRNMYKYDYLPGPAAYYPQIPKHGQGTAILLPDHFPAKFRRGARTVGPGPSYKPVDQITRMVTDARLMATKKPRVNFEKYISNCCPTIFHPEDVRCFVEGRDRRMYPWRMSRDNRDPGPKYNTFGITTSRTRSTPVINFSTSSERPPLFRIEKGFGPADFTINRSLKTQGGAMLGKTSDPKRSDLRYFDILLREAIKENQIRVK